MKQTRFEQWMNLGNHSCKPCITIRMVLKLLWKNYITEATQRFKDEYRSQKMIGITECVLPTIAEAKPTADVLKIRELANLHYNPTLSESYETMKRTIAQYRIDFKDDPVKMEFCDKWEAHYNKRILGRQ